MKRATLTEQAGLAWVGLCVLIMLGGLTGCDMDTYLDPSNVGRHESTPIVLPILDRLDVVEEPEETIPGLDQPNSTDLFPEVSEYALGPGDLITVTIFELFTPGVESVQTRRIDELGYIRLPVVGQIRCSGMTTKQLEQRIIDILDPDFLRNPTVTVIVQEGRQKTFNILGAAGAVGTYTLLKSNFRLLDAIALARGVPSDVQKIYVIRQIPLSDLVEKGYTLEDAAPGTHLPPLSPSHGGGTAAPSGSGDVDPGKLLEDLANELEGGTSDSSDAPKNDGAPATGDVASPLAEAMESGAGGSTGRWINVGGKWVQVEAEPMPSHAGMGEGPSTGAPDSGSGIPSPDQLVTQRVIEVDAQQLLKGVAKYNIVVRPGDLIRIPAPRTGNIFLGGAIARPGTYALPGERELTLTQAITAAGGLSPVGIPERIDIRRRLDTNSEAIVRLNYRAIAEGLQPDIYLKPSDTINVGTNVAASFAAVARNSFRMSYGFGFLLDRNFAENVFGPLQNQ